MISQFEYYTWHIVKLNCKIIFLTACLNLGITPKGLKPKFPIFAYPPSLRNDIQNFAEVTSVELTKLSIELYRNLSKEYGEKLNLLYSTMPKSLEIKQQVD